MARVWVPLPSQFKLTDVPLCGCTTGCLSAHLPAVVWRDSVAGHCEQIMLPWYSAPMPLRVPLLTLLHVHLEVELLDHAVNLCLTSDEQPDSASAAAAPLYTPASDAQRRQFHLFLANTCGLCFGIARSQRE